MPTGVTFADTRGAPAPAGRPAPAAGGLDAFLRSHRGEALAGGAALVVVVVALARKRSAGPAQGPAPATPATSAGTAYGTQTPPSAYYDTSSSYNALEQQIGNLQSQIAGLGAQAPAASVSSIPPPTAGAPAAPQTIGIGGTVYDVLGVVPPGGMAAYGGYQVAGGAPVFFGNANGIAQGPQNEVPGANVYTPDAYRSLIWHP